MAQVAIMWSEDFGRLVRTLVPFAQQMLEKYGGFHPFAAVVDNCGGIAQLGAALGSEYPEATELLVFLSSALRSKADAAEIRACGICLNVGARLPGYIEKADAICCQLEHATGGPLQLFVPFHRNSSGQLEYDKPVSLPGRASVFGTRGDGT